MKFDFLTPFMPVSIADRAKDGTHNRMTKFIAVWLGAALMVAGCAKSDLDPSAVILAEVGDEVITVEEFRLNYEFGHGHLRAGEDPKREYLNYMIYETLLAQEARAMQLDTLAAIEHARHTLREELLIERVFDEKVLAGIEVTQEEINEEINRSAVRFQFRFLPAASESDAERLHALIAEQGYEAALEQQMDRIPELGAMASELTSPYLGADEIDPELLDIIKGLELNTPSRPVEYQGGWYIFEVSDIRRRRIGPDEYEKRSATFHKVIYNRKALEKGGAFVASTMEPLNVRTKREGFDLLAEALWAWYRENTPVRNLYYYIEEEGLRTSYTTLLAENYEVLLVETERERWTVEDFLQRFTPARYTLRARAFDAFKARLADVIALVVRDEVLLEMAREERLGDHPGYRRTLRLWENKWLFQEYKSLKKADPASAWDQAPPHVTPLLDRYGVEVHTHILDTLRTEVSPQHPQMTVLLMKSNSNKMPFPIVDPGWKPAE